MVHLRDRERETRLGLTESPNGTSGGEDLKVQGAEGARERDAEAR